MKKICFFMETPFSLGGEQRVTSILANYLLQSNYNITFLLNTKKKEEDFSFYHLDSRINIIFLQKNVNLFYQVKAFLIKILKKFNYYIPVFKNCLGVLRWFYSLNQTKIVKIIQQENFDYVVGIGSYFSSILANIKSEIPLTKVIAWQHSTFENYFCMKNQRLFHQDAFVSFLFSQVDCYVCQTKADQKKILEIYQFHAQVIENPNTFSYYMPSNQEHKNFIASGRLVSLKQFDWLVDAFYQFSKANSSWNLFILGDGPERNRIWKKIQSYHLTERIFLVGKVQDPNTYYLKSSICLISSKWEGWGLVATEAMQLGLPIVAFSIPSFIEIFGGVECGKLVRLNDMDAFVEAMLLFVSDRKKRERISKNCIQQVKKFDIEIIGKKWDDIFK